MTRCGTASTRCVMVSPILGRDGSTNGVKGRCKTFASSKAASSLTCGSLGHVSQVHGRCDSSTDRAFRLASQESVRDRLRMWLLPSPALRSWTKRRRWHRPDRSPRTNGTNRSIFYVGSLTLMIRTSVQMEQTEQYFMWYPSL